MEFFYLHVRIVTVRWTVTRSKVGKTPEWSFSIYTFAL